MTGILALTALARPAFLPPAAPKLVLLISIDQGRADYIDRFSDLYLPPKKGKEIGGFRWLSETGVRYTDAHHHHLPTATGPGHSILMTGSVPALNGVVGNDWWDRAKGKARYVTDDDTVKTVGGNAKPQSPFVLKTTTVGDELKMATAGRSKVVGISFKDRASILMAGHAADEVVWYDYDTGNFVTSTFYAQTLPAWTQAFNESRAVDAYLGKSWSASLPEKDYINARNAPHEKGPKMFSHPYGTTKNGSYYANVVRSGGGQSLIFDITSKAIDADRLGQHETPDVLVVNLASNDYIGHAWGPYSPEVLDVWVQTDRELSKLFNRLDRTIPGGIDNVAIVVTADHGIAPIPGEEADVYHVDSHRLGGGDVTKAVEAALDAKYGDAKWVLGGLYEQNLYLDRTVMDAKGLKHDEVEQTAADAAAIVPGIYGAYTRTNILQGRLPNAPWSEWVTNGLNPLYGGDVMVLEGPTQVYTGATGTSHGSAWAYDTHVPILTHWGGQKAQKIARRVYTHDIASTLSTLLGIEYPSGNVGKPLYESLPNK
jgi:predicted AlkP superfamily pyrophosphatase or phosphodiesterase